MHTKSFDKAIRKYGFLSDQKGILNRYLREKEQWEAHLLNTKNFILEEINENINSIAVLGSGWLLDFPVEEVFNRNIQIDLYDLNHPKQILHFIKRWKNVRAIKYDLTGGLIEFLVEKIKMKEPLEIDIIEEFLRETKPGFDQYSLVVSLNVLSQLSRLIEEKLLNKINLNFSVEKLRSIIQTAHLESLPSGKSLIITDYEENFLENNKIIKTEKLLFCADIFKGTDKKEWIWSFDTKKMYDLNYKTSMNVFAVKI